MSENDREILNKWKAAKIDGAEMKKFCADLFRGISINDYCMQILTSLSKVYICELIEEGTVNYVTSSY